MPNPSSKVRWWHIVRALTPALGTSPQAQTREFYVGDGVLSSVVPCKRFEGRTTAAHVMALHELEARGFVVEACDCGPRPRPRRAPGQW